MHARNRISKVLGTLALALTLSPAAEAGPPLICDPFVTGHAELLPWGDGRGWHAPHAAYELRRLKADTLALLAADTPIPARMENLRRATIYAARDAAVARELLTALRERVRSASDTRTRALAQFDTGFLIESFRQITGPHMPEFLRVPDALASEIEALDGYGLVREAISAAPAERPEMEFAASLMTRDVAAAAAHRVRAAAAAAPGSVLAANLAR